VARVGFGAIGQRLCTVVVFGNVPEWLRTLDAVLDVAVVDGV